MKAALLRNVVLPTWQYVRGQRSLERLPELVRTQWLSADELADLQWQRIGALLRHAYVHVPYYREVMDACGATPASLVNARSLAALPLLPRSTVRERVSALKSTNMRPERFVANGTGGSTGEPLRFFDDREESDWSNAAVWRSQQWLGVDVGERCAYLWGANFDITSFQGASGRLKSGILNMLMLPAWELNEPTASRFWTQLVDFRPRLLVAYAGALSHFARMIGPGREPIPCLEAIIVSAETLLEDARARIEACFRVPVYNRYGGRDLKFVAQECRQRQGLHINSETVFVEVVRDGKVAQPGELGEIVLTRLDNFAMPFIRYQSGDLGVMGQTLCSCGRGLPLLQRVEGRVQDAILRVDGTVVSSLFVAHMMKDCPDVQEFQVHQLAIDRLRILIVLVRGAEFVSHDRIERIVRKQVGDDMRIEFEIRRDIPLTRSGKRRIAVSHLTDAADAGYTPVGHPS